MAQYFVIGNFDKKEVLAGAWFGLTDALPDLLRPGDGVMTGLGVLLALSGSGRYSSGPLYGRWAGDRIAIIGDYYEGPVGRIDAGSNIWGDMVSQLNGWVDISEHVRKLLETEWEMTMRPLSVYSDKARSVLHVDGTASAAPE